MKNSDLKKPAVSAAAALASMRAAYGQLHDMLSDMIEGGRWTEADSPDDFRAIVEQMAGPCAAADAQCERVERAAIVAATLGNGDAPAAGDGTDRVVMLSQLQCNRLIEIIGARADGLHASMVVLQNASATGEAVRPERLQSVRESLALWQAVELALKNSQPAALFARQLCRELRGRETRELTRNTEALQWDNREAQREGWCIVDADEKEEIHRVGDHAFASDAAAAEYVRRIARTGSAYHLQACRICEVTP